MFRLIAAVLTVSTITACQGRADEAGREAAIRDAVTRGLVLVQKAAANYPNNRECFSCHHQTLPMLAMAVAKESRIPLDEKLLQDQADFTLESFRDKRQALREGRGIGGAALTVSYALWALELAGREADETTEAMVDYLLKTQKPDGHWLTGNRPPLEESMVTTTVLSASVMSRFCSEAQRNDTLTAGHKALNWLRHAPMKRGEDRASRVRGYEVLGAPEELPSAFGAILEAQRGDGGWASADSTPSDAYATGQTLFRLRGAGFSLDHPAFRRGVDFLLKTRQDDGSWKVETRSKPIQVYFDNGDPHGKHQFISTPATAWAVVALAATLAPKVPTENPEPYDLVIRGGRIVDGTGNPWFLGDLAVRGDRIAAVGRLPEGVPARRVIEAKGLVVAPGFIDMHAHSDMSLLEDGAGMSKVTQGVTTEVLGEDTSGGPEKGKRPPRSFRKGEKTLSWSTLGGYLDALEASGTATNVVTYVGLGTLLGCVQGDALERPNSSQLEELKTLLDEAMVDGAFGLSTMLASPRELNVTADDLVALCGVVRKHGGLYSSHIRNEGTEVLAAIDEAIAVGERSGVPVDIIHLKIADQTLWGRMEEIIARINEARRRGVNVQANVYPYTRGNNDLVSILPPWAHEGGLSALLGRLGDPVQRAKIKVDVLKGLPGWYNHYTAVGGDWSRMLVSARLSEKNARFQGKTMDLILEELGRGEIPKRDPIDVFLDFLAEEKGSVSTIYAHHTEADMNRALTQPWCSIGSDGSALSVEGPLRKGHPHPRNFGTFPRVLGIYVRERHLLTLEDAVRKMTSLNAAKLGIVDRGLLRTGQFADVTVFDQETVVDRSTYLDPFRYSEGVVHVLVNGVPVFETGKSTGNRPGRALRHTSSTR